MSKKPPYIISESAMSDLMQIKIYSDNQWGKARTKEYLKNIHDKCLNLCLFPQIGIDIAGIGQGIKSVTVESHVVFYKIHNNKVNIARVLHENMDFTNDELFCRISN